jgi:GyrI-like small molecule binding domain
LRQLRVQLERDVILPLLNPSRYRRYKLSIPNGILLYGPLTPPAACLTRSRFWFTIQECRSSVNVQTVHPRKLAAVRREVAPGAVGSAWGPALGKVWEFIRCQPGLRTDGHNIFLYHHPKRPGAPIPCDFGVEVTRTFETAGEVHATETPGGEAAVAVHRGPYNRMNEAHNAIGKWMAANRRESSGHSWEIYGDPTPDPADTETTVVTS